MVEYSREDQIIIQASHSGDGSLAKIRLLGYPTAAEYATRKLIQTSDETPIEDRRFRFAGRHLHMPRQEVWAMSENPNETITVFVPEILDKVKLAFTEAEDFFNSNKNRNDFSNP